MAPDADRFPGRTLTRPSARGVLGLVLRRACERELALAVILRYQLAVRVPGSPLACVIMSLCLTATAHLAAGPSM